MEKNKIKYCDFNNSKSYLCNDSIALWDKIGCRYFIESNNSDKKGECSFKPEEKST